VTVVIARAFSKAWPRPEWRGWGWGVIAANESCYGPEMCGGCWVCVSMQCNVHGMEIFAEQYANAARDWSHIGVLLADANERTP